MASKFSQFLSDNKIDPRRVISVSHRLESLRPEDRRLRQAKKKKGDDAGKADEGDAQGPQKGRSGRAVSPVLLRRLEAGGKVTGPAKHRLLRAVNHILTARKKDPVELRELF